MRCLVFNVNRQLTMTHNVLAACNQIRSSYAAPITIRWHAPEYNLLHHATHLLALGNRVCKAPATL